MLLRVVIPVFVATGTFAVLSFVPLIVGGSECDKGECNWFGEIADDTAPLYAILALLLAVAAAWASHRAIGRQR